MDVWYILMAISLVGFCLSLIAFMWTAIHWRVPDLWSELQGGSRKRQAKRSKAKHVVSSKEYMEKLGHSKVNEQSQIDFNALRDAKERNLQNIAVAKSRNVPVRDVGDYDENVDWDSAENSQVKELDQRIVHNAQRATSNMQYGNTYNYQQEQPAGYGDSYTYEEEQPTGYMSYGQNPYNYEEEQPTGYMSYEQKPYNYKEEQPTGYLEEEGYDQPTGYLEDEGYAQSTGYLEEEGYDQPTGYLQDDGYEQPTGYLDDESDYDQPTGYLSQTFEEYPEETQLTKDITAYEMEMSNAEQESCNMNAQDKYLRRKKGISNALSSYNNRKITVLVDKSSDG